MTQRPTTALLAFLSILALGAPSPMGAVPTTCANLERLVLAGFLDEARKGLTTLAEEEFLVCGPEIRTGLSDAYLERGEALSTSGLDSASQEAFLGAVELDPANARAVKVLRAHADGAFAAALRLYDQGEMLAAKEKAVAVLEAHPQAELPDELESLFARRWVWWRGVRSATIPTVPTLLEIAAVGGILILVAAFLWRRFSPWSHRRLSIDAFQSVGVQGVDGGAFTGLLQHYLVDLATGDPNPTTISLTGPVEALELPDFAGSVIPGGSSLVTGLNLLAKRLERRLYEVSGVLHPGGRDGPGVTVRLTLGAKTLATVSLWYRQFAWPDEDGEPKAYDEFQRLAEVAAVWLLFELSNLIGVRRTPFRLLGTDSWRAFAYFRIGLETFGERNEPGPAEDRAQAASEAIFWFERALRVDPSLFAARVNLAWLFWADRHDEAKRHLEIAREQTATGNRPAGAPTTGSLEEAWQSLLRSGQGEPLRRWRRTVVVHDSPVAYFQIRHALLAARVGALDASEPAGSGRNTGDDLVRDMTAFARRLEDNAATYRPTWSRGWTSKGRETRRRLRSGLGEIAHATLPLVAVLEFSVRRRTRSKPPNYFNELWQLARDSVDGHFVFNTACALAFWLEQRDVYVGEEAEEVMKLVERACEIEPFRLAQAERSSFLIHLSETETFRRLFPDAEPAADGNSGDDGGWAPAIDAVLKVALSAWALYAGPCAQRSGRVDRVDEAQTS